MNKWKNRVKRSALEYSARDSAKGKRAYYIANILTFVQTIRSH